MGNTHGGVFKNDRGDGPRGTPTVDGNRLFALGERRSYRHRDVNG